MSERRLAAIMFIEFISQEASGTVEFSKELSSLKSIIENHSGKWSNYKEGSKISIFDSALDAVEAALEILEHLKNDVDNIMRMGIHLGDVTIDGTEIHGDGLDMASRIATTADAGSVLISEAVHGAVKGVEHVHTQLLGDKIFDDTNETVRIYQLGIESMIGIQGGKSWSKYVIPTVLVILAIALGIWKFSGKGKEEQAKTLLILPFEFVEADSSNEHLTNWVLTELIRNLGNTNSLTVLNQATSKVFRASLNPIADATEQLDQADFFVNGSIKAEIAKITIDAEIYDRQEVKIWSESYASALDSLSWMINKMAMDIIEALKVKLAVKEYRRIAELEPIETELFELRAKAWNQLSKWTPEGFANAKVYLNEMVDTYPTSSRSWAMHAQGLISMGHSSYPPPGIWEEVKAAAERALQYDALNAQAWAALACSKTYGEQDFEGAIKAYKKANALNPNMGWNHYHYAWHLYLYDQLEEAIVEHTIAQDLDPLMPGHTYWLGFLLVQNDDFEQAMEKAKRLLRIRKDSLNTYNLMGLINFKQERYDSALYFYEKANNALEVSRCKFRLGDIDPIMGIIRSIKDKPLNSWRAYLLADLYAEIDSLDRFFEYANFEPPSYSAPYLRVIITNPNVLKDPRFKELMAKFDLPMPQGYE
jgi:adenylate cyclase